MIKDRFGTGGSKPGVFLEALRYGTEFFDRDHAGRHPELRPALEPLARASSFHIFGGGYINTGIRPDSGFLIGVAAAIARRYAIPVFATGIGITPLSLDECAGAGALAEALAAFLLFECRDTYGFDKLFELADGRAEIVSGVDDSFLLRPPTAPRPGGGGPALHVSLLRKPPEGRNAALHDEIVALAGRFERVHLLELRPKPRRPESRAAAARLPRLEVLDCHAMIHAPLPVQPGDFMVTQRFHPHLIAARLGCTGIFIEDGIYYFDKHHSILHLGSGFRKYAPGQLQDSDTRGPGAIVVRDPENMARKARVRTLATAPARRREAHPPMQLVIHAGIHRTGTTSLQRCWRGTARRSQRAGVAYPGEAQNHQPLAWSLFRRQSGTAAVLELVEAARAAGAAG